MKFEIHSHSHYSKGTKLSVEVTASPKDVIRKCKNIGLTGVAITDHNSISSFKEAKAEAKKHGLIFIPGEEITTDKGHVIGLGLNEFIPKHTGFEETIDRIHDQGGLAMAPHPFDMRDDGVKNLFRKCDAVEVFNSLNLDRFSNIVARRRAGDMVRVAGSDAHTLEMIGNSINIIDADSLDEFLKKLKQGKVNYTGNYTTAREMVNWSYERLLNSKKDAIERINNYNSLKGWISLRLMNKFLRNQGGFFTFLSKFGISCSCGYGFARALRYV